MEETTESTPVEGEESTASTEEATTEETPVEEKKEEETPVKEGDA